MRMAHRREASQVHSPLVAGYDLHHMAVNVRELLGSPTLRVLILHNFCLSHVELKSDSTGRIDQVK